MVEKLVTMAQLAEQVYDDWLFGLECSVKRVTFWVKAVGSQSMFDQSRDFFFPLADASILVK